jgi:hypothetical protein
MVFPESPDFLPPQPAELSLYEDEEWTRKQPAGFFAHIRSVAHPLVDFKGVRELPTVGCNTFLGCSKKV